MRVGFVIPAFFLLLLVGGLPAVFNASDTPNPDDVLLFTEESYQDKAKDYAKLGQRQDALDTCAEIEKFDNPSAQEICLIDVYDELNDIDGKIEVYERKVERKIANGDSGTAAKRTLEILKQRRDKEKR